MQEPTIQRFDQVDLDGLCARMGLMAFDLDGTLAQSKKPMHPDMAHMLSRLTTLVPVAIVSGGTMALVESQITDVLGPEADRANMHLMPTTGTRYYRWDGHGWVKVYEYDINPRDRQEAMALLERRAREQGIWEERTWGERIEDRGSQITFSALGQHAPVEAKERWDPGNVKKNRLTQSLQADLPHLQVRSGGLTSVDISERGRDKSFAMRQLADALHLPMQSIVFVGDRMDPDGNDYPAAKAGVTAIEVRCPADTLLLGEGIIARLERARRP
ncbi:HAD-IIB family hydrolase [Bifidobacterium cuniculi]|uniref:phosphomannomutase n=1 Tax=Bifidobacterium cuniculi TaxID=1688 RepID=A0A087B464_9BIFI|nr:HAD-IIB family hydrolase [Bifidobacterium cuniculi]KFI65814.1 phosphomannomutase [Bifidobacterium cuniculi]